MAALMIDPALDCLFWTLEREPQLGEGEKLAFLRARPHAALEQFKDRMTCEQTWKPDALSLERAGWSLHSGLLPPEPRFDRVFLRPHRQREQILFDLARGVSMLKPSGQLVVSLPNDCGAGRFEKELRRLLGSTQNHSKYHSRTFWSPLSESLDQDLLSKWLDGGRPTRILDDRYLSQPGAFSWDRVDPGSLFLVENLPKNLSGKVADLGAGWGFLSHFLLENRPAIHSLDFFEADAEALSLAAENLASTKSTAKITPHWHDVASGLQGFGPYDAIVMNPPFHRSRSSDVSLGQSFIAAAADALRDGGQLWLVANQHLPYERFMRELLPSVHLVKEENGFKILTAIKSNGAGVKGIHRP